MKQIMSSLLLILFVSAMTLYPAFSQPVSRKIVVAVTASSLTSIISAIGGEKIKVKSLVPQGADPHHYEPSETDIINAVSDTDLIVMTGPHHLLIEEKIEDLYNKGFIKSRIINYKDYIENGMVFLKNPKTNDINPHGYFFSINNSKIIALTVYKALVEMDPKDKEYFDTRYEEFIALLDQISIEIQRIRIKNLKIILLTPILQYVAKDLNMEVIDIVLPEYDIEPTEKDISNVITIMKSRKIDFMLASDIEANRLKKMINIFRNNNINIVITPVFTYKKIPYLASLITVSAIETNKFRFEYTQTGNNIGDFILIPSIVLNFVLAALSILLYYKVKNYE